MPTRARMSPGLEAWVARLGGATDFREASELLAEYTGIDLGAETVELPTIEIVDEDTRFAVRDGFEMIDTRQGIPSLSAPTKELERLILDGRLQHGGNPVLRWMADCCSVKQDAQGNLKLVKPHRQQSAKRIDGISALVMAVDRCNRDENRPSVYSRREGIVL